MPFAKGNKAARNRKPKVRTTVWVLEELSKKGVDYTQILADAIKNRDFELLDRLAKLAPHIANRPRETMGIEGIDGLVIEAPSKADDKK